MSKLAPARSIWRSRARTAPRRPGAPAEIQFHARARWTRDTGRRPLIILLRAGKDKTLGARGADNNRAAMSPDARRAVGMSGSAAPSRHESSSRLDVSGARRAGVSLAARPAWQPASGPLA